MPISGGISASNQPLPGLCALIERLMVHTNVTIPAFAPTCFHRELSFAIGHQQPFSVCYLNNNNWLRKAKSTVCLISAFERQTDVFANGL
jgi:hypothetical protein